MLNEIKTFLGQDWKDAEDLVRSSLASDIELLDKTNEAILSSTGKQLRPLISLLVSRACSGGKANRDSICCAAASELLHNATLLHDDVADGSTERRGVPTVMSILGGPAAVLLGDYWLVKAVGVILSSTKGDTIVRIFAKTLSDLAEGEMLQLQKASCCDTTEEDYYRIIYSKTASLFEAAGTSAAVSVDASEEFIRAVREYTVSLGIAFQIRDDMLDYSDSKLTGKPSGIDLEEQKITLPLLGAMAAVPEEEADGIRRKLMEIHDSPACKNEIRDFVMSNGGMEYSASTLDSYVEKAVRALDVLPDSKEKDYLVKIAAFTAARDR